MTLNIFIKKKFTLNISKYDFEYVCQRKIDFKNVQNMTLSMFVKGKVDIRHVKNMTLSMLVKWKIDFWL
jgi:hypothetical protein